jgi:hypothetical protein
MGQPFRRTRIWVDSPFQLRLLLRLVSYFALYMFVVFHIGFIWEVVRALTGPGTSHVSAQLYAEYLWKQLPMVIGFFAVAPAFLYDLVKFSHRVAGPLFRCRRLMQEMAAGKPVPEFTPRKGDLMTELFQAFNALIKTWNARIAEGADRQAQTPQAVPTALVVSPSADLPADMPV